MQCLPPAGGPLHFTAGVGVVEATLVKLQLLVAGATHPCTLAFSCLLEEGVTLLQLGWEWAAQLMQQQLQSRLAWLGCTAQSLPTTALSQASEAPAACCHQAKCSAACTEMLLPCNDLKVETCWT